MAYVSALSPLSVDAAAAGHRVRMRVRLVEGGRRINVNGLWIASTAAANSLPIHTQDRDLGPLAELGELEVITL
jgi:predicted nucleic acid-binding protein